MSDGTSNAGLWSAFGPFGRRLEQKSDKATQFLEDVEKMQTAAVLADITLNLNELNFRCRD